MGAPIGIALAGSPDSVSSDDTQSWINTLSNAGLAWYRTVNPPSPPPVRGVGLPGSAVSMTPSDGIGQWFKRNLGIVIAVVLAGGFILFYRRR